MLVSPLSWCFKKKDGSVSCFRFFFTEEAKAISRTPNQNGNAMSLSGSSGTFFSPDYPAPYISGTLCIWTITVPLGKIVELTFEDFYITLEELSRDYNFVEIRDSLYSNGTLLARSSCDVSPAYFPTTVYSTGSYLWVKFHADCSVYSTRSKDRGFKANYMAFDQTVTSVSARNRRYRQ